MRCKVIPTVGQRLTLEGQSIPCTFAITCRSVNNGIVELIILICVGNCRIVRDILERDSRLTALACRTLSLEHITAVTTIAGALT